jgi:hypothetical protein
MQGVFLNDWLSKGFKIEEKGNMEKWGRGKAKKELHTFFPFPSSPFPLNTILRQQ